MVNAIECKTVLKACHRRQRKNTSHVSKMLIVQEESVIESYGLFFKCNIYYI